MKKILLLLGIFTMAIVIVAPRSAASVSVGEYDVGKVILPADQVAQATIDCQAVVTAPEGNYLIEVRDPGSLLGPSICKASEGEAKSPAINCASSGDLTYNDFSRNRQSARLYVMNNRQRVTPSVRSTCCGGIGY